MQPAGAVIRGSRNGPGLAWSLGLLRESLRGRRDLGSPDPEDPGDPQRYSRPAGAATRQTVERIAQGRTDSRKRQRHLLSSTCVAFGVGECASGAGAADTTASWRFPRRAGQSWRRGRALYRRGRCHITVAVFVAVTDTKPRSARVQIDIWPIRTVNSSREHGSSYARHRTRWQV